VTLVGQILDPVEQCDVVIAVATTPSVGAGGFDQAFALVDPQTGGWPTSL
jgi:hypothetical protein